MNRTGIFALSIAFLSFSPSLNAKKKKPVTPPNQKTAAPAELGVTHEMTADQKALHALARLTFGPRKGDLDALKSMSLNEWIERQLNPETIPENPVLETKLAPLD